MTNKKGFCMSDLFSERYGLINTNDDYSSSFRSAIVTSFFNQYDSFEAGELLYFLREVMDLFGIEQKPQVNDMATLLSNKEQTLHYFKCCPWNHLFDFVEYVLTLDPQKADKLMDKYNNIFRMHGCKYRLVDGKAIPVVNDLEIQEITKALNTGVDATDNAYSEALSQLSNRVDPDYNAVVAKATNALESMVMAIAKDKEVKENTLGKAIDALESKGIVFDEDMKMLIKKVYAYACNAGIRHGGTNPTVATEDDAILVLVITAAEINYLNALRLSV